MHQKEKVRSKNRLCKRAFSLSLFWYCAFARSELLQCFVAVVGNIVLVGINIVLLRTILLLRTICSPRRSSRVSKLTECTTTFLSDKYLNKQSLNIPKHVSLDQFQACPSPRAFDGHLANHLFPGSVICIHMSSRGWRICKSIYFWIFPPNNTKRKQNVNKRQIT